MQEVERVLPPEGEGATGEVPKGEEDGFPPEEEIAHAQARESFLLREGEKRVRPLHEASCPRESSFHRARREKRAHLSHKATCQR